MYCKLIFPVIPKRKEVSQKIEQPLAGAGGATNPDGSKIAM
jgi:hypothetical protein